MATPKKPARSGIAEYFGVQDLALRYTISESSARKLLKENHLPVVRIGGLIRVSRAAVEQFEASISGEAISK